MRIKAEMDLRALTAFTTRQRKRLAFNTAQALNATGKRIQEAERRNMQRKLTLRRETFMLRLIRIFSYASARQGRPAVELGIDSSKKGVLLGLLERGGTKHPAKGKSVGVPLTGTSARPIFQQEVPKQLWFRNLRFRKHRTRTGKTQLKSRTSRAFVIPGLGVLLRGASVKTTGRKTFVGRGGHRLRNTTLAELIYSFERGPRLKPVLGFLRTARETFRRAWAEEFAKAYRK